MESTLNSELLASMIKSKRGKKGLREVATEISKEIGDVSAATLSRIEQGKLPDVETFIKICKWLNVATDEFIVGKKTSISKLTEKELVLSQLRASRELDEDTIEAMVSMVNMAFTKVRKHAHKK